MKTKSKTFSSVVVIVLILSLALPAGVLAAPSNDNFVDAVQITSLPLSVNHDTTGATFETEEPYPSCGSGSSIKTAWFAYTPASNETLIARANYYYFPTLLAILNKSPV